MSRPCLDTSFETSLPFFCGRAATFEQVVDGLFFVNGVNGCIVFEAFVQVGDYTVGTNKARAASEGRCVVVSAMSEAAESISGSKSSLMTELP
jgi:hypothetical protein